MATEILVCANDIHGELAAAIFSLGAACNHDVTSINVFLSNENACIDTARHRACVYVNDFLEFDVRLWERLESSLSPSYNGPNRIVIALPLGCGNDVAARAHALTSICDRDIHVLVVQFDRISAHAIADACILWVESSLVGFEDVDASTSDGAERLHALLGWTPNGPPLCTRFLQLRSHDSRPCINIDFVHEVDCLLGEGAVWDARNKRLLWVDIDTGRVFSMEHQEDHRAKSVPRIFTCVETVGTVVARARGVGFVAATRTSILCADGFDDANPTQTILDVSIHPPHHRLNDGKCDPAGRLIVGSIAADAEYGETGTASLFAVDPDSNAHPTVRTILKNVTVSNGLVWSADGSTMYYIDSPTLCVFAFDYSVATASVSHRRTILRFSSSEGVPDGMAIDADGMLWIAHWEGACVTRNDPATGTVLSVVHVPALRVTSCAFGGPDLDTLYITSARRGLSEDQLRKYPLSGSLFVVRNVGVKGVRSFEYAS